MGCHTWCFVALPKKQKEWRLGLVDTAKSTLKFLKGMLNDKSSIEKLVKEEANQHEGNIKYFGELLEKETDPKKRLKYQQYVEQHKKALRKSTFEYFVEIYQKSANEVEEFLKGYNKELVGDPIKFFKWWSNVPEVVLDGFSDFGLYHIHDNKIYKEDDFGEELKYTPINDGDFRIYDYEAKPCYTAQDCFDRCAEYDVTLDNYTKQRITDWFNAYPDSLVEFG